MMLTVSVYILLIDVQKTTTKLLKFSEKLKNVVILVDFLVDLWMFIISWTLGITWK